MVSNYFTTVPYKCGLIHSYIDNKFNIIKAQVNDGSQLVQVKSVQAAKRLITKYEKKGAT